MERKKKVKAIKQRIHDLAGNEKNISGIHNYCDRWCERCVFTAKCAVYDMELQSQADSENKDQENAFFWEELSLMFEATFEMLREKAEELGIDLNAIPESELVEHVETEAEKVSYQYGSDVHVWLKENGEYIENKAQVLLSISEETAFSYKDAIEIIEWYSFFIHVKTHRAFSGLDDEQDEFNIEEVNLSAKIALIAVGRAMAAFSFLYNHLTEKEDEILDFLAKLAKIKRLILAAFPHAMSFKRPGFDE